jgi:hypothetical protein
MLEHLPGYDEWLDPPAEKDCTFLQQECAPCYCDDCGRELWPDEMRIEDVCLACWWKQHPAHVAGMGTDAWSALATAVMKYLTALSAARKGVEGEE